MARGGRKHSLGIATFHAHTTNGEVIIVLNAVGWSLLDVYIERSRELGSFD